MGREMNRAVYEAFQSRPRMIITCTLCSVASSYIVISCILRRVCVYQIDHGRAGKTSSPVDHTRQISPSHVLGVLRN